MSQLVFGIPREYAFLFFHNNWDTAYTNDEVQHVCPKWQCMRISNNINLFK